MKGPTTLSMADRHFLATPSTNGRRRKGRVVQD
jgi:hypothetical protein